MNQENRCQFFPIKVPLNRSTHTHTQMSFYTEGVRERMDAVAHSFPGEQVEKRWVQEEVFIRCQLLAVLLVEVSC